MGKSAVNAYLRLNREVWSHLPPPVRTFPPIRLYGSFVNRLVRWRSARRQYFATYVLRNRPQLQLISRLSDQMAVGSTLRLAVLGCSNGAEVYSTLWTIRSRRPDLNVISHAVDISKDIVELAEKAVYSLKTPELVDSPIFARMSPAEMQAMFDADGNGDTVRIKPWLKEGITWHIGDAGSPELIQRLGPQDMVTANNFLCHMEPSRAERCLRTIARLVSPEGYVVVSGIDLDVRTRVAQDLGWRPVRELLEDIHDGEETLRAAWPCDYWGLEALDKTRRDWEVRYASVFQVSERA